MTGLLIVSHSATLAEGVAELVRTMAPGVPIAVVGGDRERLGVSADGIIAGWQHLASQARSAVALFDLGSSLLNLENAVELAGAKPPCPLTIADAPLVEGAVAAALAALTGGGMEAVRADAEAARGLPKRG